MVFLRRKSRTATVPRVTLVSVPSQRSAVIQIVPRTVAAERLPRVRKRPLALALSLRSVRLESLAAEARLPRFLVVQLLKLEPFNLSSVRPLSRFLRDCSTWNRPALNLPSWVFWPAPVALTISTVPRLVSRNDPTGIWRSSVSGSKCRPFWDAPARAERAPPPGTAMRTVPEIRCTFTARPSTGAGRPGGGGAVAPASNAPMSQAAPWGLAVPRSSVAGHGAPGPRPWAGWPAAGPTGSG